MCLRVFYVTCKDLFCTVFYDIIIISLISLVCVPAVVLKKNDRFFRPGVPAVPAPLCTASPRSSGTCSCNPPQASDEPFSSKEEKTIRIAECEVTVKTIH